MSRQIIILAAGNGRRMKSDLPKVMHKVAGKPMLERVVENCSQVTDDLILVYSEHLKPYLSGFEDKCKFALQKQPLGTAHAVAAATDLINNKVNTAVIYGDNPLITADIINELLDYLEETKSDVVTLAFNHHEPNQYGRIIVDDYGNFQKIIEYKFANEQEREIKLCNSGIMAFAPDILPQYLPKCLRSDPDNSGKEFYLTEIIEICNHAGCKVSYYVPENNYSVIGVNTQEELKNANEIIAKGKI